MKKLTLIASMIVALASFSANAKLTDSGKCEDLGKYLAKQKDMKLSASLVGSTKDRAKGKLDCVLLFKPKPTTLKETYTLDFKNKKYEMLKK